MKTRTVFLAATAILTSASLFVVAAPQAGPAKAAPKAAAKAKPVLSAKAAPHKVLVDRYCNGCHNSRTKTAGLALEVLNLGNVGPDAEVWEKAARKLRAGMMPPPGAPQPDRAAVTAMVGKSMLGSSETGSAR
jgi:hypothetical protein